MDLYLIDDILMMYGILKFNDIGMKSIRLTKPPQTINIIIT